MKCPECQASLHETVEKCPQCGFSLYQLSAEFGRLPTIKGVVTDLPHKLGYRDAAKARSAIRRFVRQFPDIRFHVILTGLHEEDSIAKYAFWIFNQSGICSTLHKGGLNFNILLVLDTAYQRANLSIGYGLEPFVSAAHLDAALSKSKDALKAEDYATTITTTLAELTNTLHEVGDKIPKTYGLRRKERPDDPLE